MKSGKQIGDEYAETLASYLEALQAEGKGLPSRSGKISAKAVALASGVDAQSLYKNVRCRAMLEAAAQLLGLTPMEARKTVLAKDDTKDRRIQTLEAQVSSLQAEVEGLRQKLRYYAHLEAHMVKTGRRVIP